jgi:hypothetical protein
MKEFKTVFKDEDAVRLLNYFISYKEIVSKNDNHLSIPVEDFEMAVLPKPEELVVK